jgi:tubulin gamma
MEVHDYWPWLSPDYILSVCCWFYVILQDPDNLLTEEGNAKGTVDPKLAIWITK